MASWILTTLTGNVTGHVIDDNLIKFNGNATLDWDQGSVKLASNAVFVDGLITGNFNFQSDFDLNFSARGSGPGGNPQANPGR